MTIHLPEYLERYVHDQVQAGLYPTEDEVITDALERHRQSQQPPATPAISGSMPGSELGLIGALRDDAELLDQAVEHAMKVREERPWRLAPGE
jgi:Arc/MetJ-type ribon-helix-helix transcriptional regulator